MHKIYFLIVLPLALTASLVSTRTPSATQQEDYRSAVAKRVKIEKIPATNVISLPTSGNYEQHPQVVGRLIKYVSEYYATAGPVFGIYPVDPDTVGVPFPTVETGQSNAPDQLRNASKLPWEVCIRVLPGRPNKDRLTNQAGDPFRVEATEQSLRQPIAQLTKPQAPFKLKQLPEITAAVLESDIVHTPKDGLALNVWVIENGYVQIAPVRMEYALNTADPTKATTRIIVPVIKRKSGLSLK